MRSKAVFFIYNSCCCTSHRKIFLMFLLLGIFAIPGCYFFQGRTSMFDGKSLGYWETTKFYGAGDVYVRDGCLILEKGDFMTGVTWTGPFIRTNYKISLEAMRIEGSDFFCCLTFPFGESSCSLVLGGWGGQVTGISSLDQKDAARNETTLTFPYEENRWYKVDLQVTSDRIRAWLDDQPLVNVETTGKDIGIRAEVVPSRPLGIATYRTTGAIRNISISKL